MPIYELNDECLTQVQTTRFGNASVKEREDLQRLLRDQIEVLVPDVLQKKSPFNRPEVLREIANRLQPFDGKELSDDELGRRRRIPLVAFADADALAKVCQLGEWMIEQARAETAAEGGQDVD